METLWVEEIVFVTSFGRTRMFLGTILVEWKDQRGKSHLNLITSVSPNN